MTIEGKPGPSRSTTLILPIFASACALFAILLLLSSGLGAKLHLWHFRTGFSMIRAAAYMGFGCAVLALVSGIVSARRRHTRGVVLSLIALILALVALGIPMYWKVQAQKHPRIHDITTDVNNPPAFVAVSTARGQGVRYGGAEVAVQQLKAYPELRTVVLPIPKDQAFKEALAAAHDMGWEIVAERPAQGTIEATDTTFWFGFKDDIVIRVFPAGQRSLLDVRSVSRVGISDVGTNARRIRAYLGKLNVDRR